MDISLSHPPSTARSSCFAKRFSKTVSASPPNPLHQHSHCRSFHSHSHSRAKRTLRVALRRWKTEEKKKTKEKKIRLVNGNPHTTTVQEEQVHMGF
jgi:hypothetical protein